MVFKAIEIWKLFFLAMHVFLCILPSRLVLFLPSEIMYFIVVLILLYQLSADVKYLMTKK